VYIRRSMFQAFSDCVGWCESGGAFLADRRAVGMICRLSVSASVRHSCTVAKRCKIGPRLLLITNRKAHTGFRMRC